MEVVQLRPSPSLIDLPGQLRQMADSIERGNIEATSALFIIPREGDWPELYGWGEHMGDYANIALCEMAKAWFIDHKVTRRT